MNILIQGKPYTGFAQVKKHVVKANEVQDFIASHGIKCHSNVVMLDNDLATFYEIKPKQLA